MISISNLSKNYGKKILFDGLNLNINRGEKIGLIGPNGSGKSTLFSIILQDNEPSSGSVQVIKGTRIGYLPQESSFKSAHTVLAELTEGDATLMRLKAEKYRLEADNKAGSDRYGEILHELEVLGYFELEHKAKKILAGLGFKEEDFNRPVADLSGGWQMRTLLGKLLTFDYDLLLLDEPTNYLDLNAALWLKEYLAQFRGTFLMISHDKAFLNEVTNYTLILENGSIFKVRGNYQHYEQIKDQKRIFLLRQFKEQEKKRKQLEEFIARFHAQPNKAQQVRAKRSELERMEEVVLLKDPRESIKNFHFPQTRKSGHRVVSLNKVSKSYGANQVYKDFDFEVTQGQKAVLAGENGAGKSTLLKILAGVIDIDSGERNVGHHVEAGYFSQTRTDVLNLENTVLEEAYSAAPGLMSQEAIRTILGAFLFTGDDADKRVKVLSGGEKSRLILAKLLIKPPNFLLLDEPTTHLDVDAVDALIKALTEYEGTIVFISHDIHFVRSVANIVFEVKSGQVRTFAGNFDYYLDKKKSADYEHFVAAAHPKPAHDKVSQAAALKKQQDLAHKQQERLRKEQNALLKNQIKELASEREKLNLERLAKSRAISNPRGYRDDASLEEYMLRVEELQKLMADINDRIRALKKQIKDNT